MVYSQEIVSRTPSSRARRDPAGWWRTQVSYHGIAV